MESAASLGDDRRSMLLAISDESVAIVRRVLATNCIFFAHTAKNFIAK
jgi:hypothetical protein